MTVNCSKSIPDYGKVKKGNVKASYSKVVGLDSARDASIGH